MHQFRSRHHNLAIVIGPSPHQAVTGPFACARPRSAKIAEAGQPRSVAHAPECRVRRDRALPRSTALGVPPTSFGTVSRSVRASRESTAILEVDVRVAVAVSSREHRVDLRAQLCEPAHRFARWRWQGGACSRESSVRALHDRPQSWGSGSHGVEPRRSGAHGERVARRGFRAMLSICSPVAYEACVRQSPRHGSRSSRGRRVTSRRRETDTPGQVPHADSVVAGLVVLTWLSSVHRADGTSVRRPDARARGAAQPIT